jgi:tight adherence protein B
MSPLIVNILAFAAVFFTVLALNAVLVDIRLSDDRRVKQRVEERYRERQKRQARNATRSLDFAEIAAQAQSENSSNLSLVQKLEHFLVQSGVSTTAGRIIALCASLGAAALLAGTLLFGPVIGVAVALASGSLPLAWLQLKRQRRLESMRGQLPEAFGLMSRVLRAGQSVGQAMQAVATEFPSPVSLEFLYCSEQVNLGLSPELALRTMAQRTGLLEIKIFVVAVVVHRQTGGNLAELLDKLSHLVRERFRIRGMVRSLTAQGRFQAGILLSLPPAMFLLLLVLHREYEMVLFEYPAMILTALGMMALGAFWIRRIINFDF